jgi:endonuclease YncB( thermonuclease family)
VLNQAGQLTLAQQRLQFDRDKAAAEALLKANGGDVPYDQRPVNIANKILTEQKNKVRTLEQAAENANLGKSTFNTMDDVDAAFKKKQPWYKTSTTSSAMDEIKKILIADPTFVKLDPKRQAAIYADTISRMENNNVAGAHDYIVTDGNRKEYAQMAQDSIKAFTGHIGVVKGQVDVLNQDTVLRLNREAQVPLQTAKDMVAYDMGRVDTNPNANAKPAAQTPLQATNAAKIAGLQEKLNTKGLDVLQKASIEKQLKDLGATPQTVTPVAKQVQKSVYVKTPLDIVAQAVNPRPTPLLPAANQNAFKDKANNLSIDVGTGKTTPAKNPVAIPDVTWGEPVQAVTLDPILAKLPQHTFVATFVPDGDTARGESKTHTTVGQPQGKVICRIDSVNAPETSHKAGQPTQTYGEEAGKILQKMILNKEVSIRVTKPTDGSSNYGRDVCQIEVSGKDVSVELLRAGAAWIYPAYNHYGAGGVALQEEAKVAGRGLWLSLIHI